MKFIEMIESQGGEVYEVGGTLRDRLLGLPEKDQDLLVTKIPLADLVGLLSKLGRVQQVGKSFGVLKFKPHRSSTEYDIALPRKERSTGKGHRDFEVEFDPFLSVEEDLARRDFTLNAMAKNLKTGALIDPHQGLADLKNKILKQVFEKTFEEDPLRLLRGVQFAARFQLQIDSNTLEGMKQNAALLKTVSPERVIQELEKLFLAKKPSVGLQLLRQIQLLKILFPWLSEDSLFEKTIHFMDAVDPTLLQAERLILFFSILFFECPKNEALAWMNRYKITMLNLQAQDILHLIDFSKNIPSPDVSEPELRRFLHHAHPVWVNLILELAHIKAFAQKDGKTLQDLKTMGQRLQKILSEKPPLFLKDLAIDGNDLLKMGFEKGPKLGKILQGMLAYVLEDPRHNTREKLNAFLKSLE